LKILVSILFYSIYLCSAVVDGVAIKVNNEIISIYDIKSLQKELKNTKEESIDILIDSLVKKEVIKQIGINVPLGEVREYIQRLASSNNMTFDMFRNAISQKVSWDIYKKQISNKLENDKLVQYITSISMNNISDSVFERFYNKNKNKFKIFLKLDVIRYISDSQEDLLKLIQNPLIKSVYIKKEKKILYKKDFVNKSVYQYLSNMKLNKLSPIVIEDDKFISYIVNKKTNKKYAEYDKIKDKVKQTYINQNIKNLMKEYIENIKSSVDIEYVR
jgi:hypothetical protein